MTDKEKLEKVRAEIERLKEETSIGLSEHENGVEHGRMEIINALYKTLDSIQEEPKDRCRGCNNVKGCITCVDGSEYAHIEECNITGIKSKHAIGKLKECIDNITEEGLEEARKQLEELTKECMYSKDNYTDKDRKALCDGCNEECEFNKKEEPVSEDKMTISKEWFEHCKKSWYNEGYIDGEYNRDRQFKESVSEDLEEFINTIKLLTSNTALLTFEYGCREGAKWQKQQDQSIIELAEDHAMLAGMEKMKQQMLAKAVELTIREGEHGDPYLIYVPDVEAMGLKAGDKVKVLIVKEE